MTTHFEEHNKMAEILGEERRQGPEAYTVRFSRFGDVVLNAEDTGRLFVRRPWGNRKRQDMHSRWYAQVFPVDVERKRLGITFATERYAGLPYTLVIFRGFKDSKRPSHSLFSVRREIEVLAKHLREKDGKTLLEKGLATACPMIKNKYYGTDVPEWHIDFSGALAAMREKRHAA